MATGNLPPDITLKAHVVLTTTRVKERVLLKDLKELNKELLTKVASESPELAKTTYLSETIAPDEPYGRIFEDVARMHAMERSQFEFRYNGRVIKDTDTPTDLGITKTEQIEIFLLHSRR